MSNLLSIFTGKRNIQFESTEKKWMFLSRRIDALEGSIRDVNSKLVDVKASMKELQK